MVDKYYIVHDNCSDVIYVTDDRTDAIKTSVEWFFGIEENPFGYYSWSGVRSFEKGKLRDSPPCNEDQILRFEFEYVEKIFNLYKKVPNPDLQIIDVLEKLIDAKRKTREKAEKIARIKQKIKTLETQSAELNSEIQTAFINPLVDASQGAERFIYCVSNLHQIEEERQKRRKKELAKSKDAIFGSDKNLNLQFIPADVVSDDDIKCLICKEKGPMYFVTLTEIDTEGDDDVRSTGNLCCNCFEKNTNQILQGKVDLEIVTYT